MAQKPDELMGQDGLPPLQERFLDEYFKDFRPKAAAVRAGYAERNAAHSAWRLLQKPAIAERVRERRQIVTDRLRLSADRLVWEHARIALSDMGRIVRFTGKGPRLRARGEIGPDESAAVREVSRSRGGFQVKLYDKRGSLAFLTRIFGVVERHQAPDAQAAIEREASYRQARDQFLALIESMRERLKTDPEMSPLEALADGVVRDDDEAKALARAMRLVE